MKNIIYILPLLTVLAGNRVCAQAAIIINIIPAPEGYKRIYYPQNTFSSWVQNLPLKDSQKISSHEGGYISRAIYRIYAVVDKPLLFKRDLEQCADYCMRFWADYHRETDKLEKLYLFDYHGNKKMFSKSKKPFIKFLRLAMAYSNSYSLKKGCEKVNPDSLIPGDMLVQNKRGSIGHVSMVLDVCENHEGKQLYLIGYSFMPAQEFHIEKADETFGLGGWFTLEGYYQYLEQFPFVRYGKPFLRRFAPL